MYNSLTYHMDLQVLFEDNHLIAINKPPGYLVQGDQTGDPVLADLVKNYIKFRYDKPGAVFLGVIHRLDRPVSGALIFARTSKALQRMNRIFQERAVTKTYWAIVGAAPEPLSATLVDYIYKDSAKNRAHAIAAPSRRHPDAKRAELSYRLLQRIGSQYLLEVQPITGRPHQIRVQLASRSLPIRGDLKYGYPKPNPDGNISLHCRSLSFEHPVKREPLTIIADPPLEGGGWEAFSLE